MMRLDEIGMNWSHFVVFWLVSLSGGMVDANQSLEDPNILKAVYLEKLARQVEWPKNGSAQIPMTPFVMVVFGENPFGTALEQVYSAHQFLDRDLQVRYVSDLKDIGDCHLLFISSSDRKRVKEVLEVVKDKPILTVGDTKGFVDKGVHINFVPRGSNVRFEINKKTAEESGLRMSYRILKLAIRVVKR